jgi:uroporphyrinogen-III decarboxylase
MVSGDTFEQFILPYVNMVAGECYPYGVHHCGSIDAVVKPYAKIKNLAFMEIGFVSDVARARKILGYHVAADARIDPVKMLQETPDVIREEVLSLIRQGRPYHNYSIDTVGCGYGTPDENIRMAFETVGEFGTYHEEEEIEWMRAQAGA